MRFLSVSLVLLVTLASLQCGLAEFRESFTTNPEATPATSTAPFLWADTPELVEGGRGPVDARNPTGNHAFKFQMGQGVSAETVLMNWDNSVDQSTALTFFVKFQTDYACEPVGLFKLMVSDDGVTWQNTNWNRTAAQLKKVDLQWESHTVTWHESWRADPIAFKWTLSASGQCWKSFFIYLDDITFPTIAPSAETYLLGKAPEAPLPSPSVCAALSQYCTGGTGAATTSATPLAGGRRLMLRHA